MRRLGSTPQQRGSLSGETCPDIIELSNGDFLIIGKKKLPSEVTARELVNLDASIDLETEEAVIIPRRVLLDAKKDIPDE